MSEHFSSSKSPLSDKDVELIDALNLDTSQKHHLRILAHCLFSMKEIKFDGSGNFPSNEERLKWCREFTNSDDQFTKLLLEQINNAVSQLENLSTFINKEPMRMSLDDLVNAFKAKYSL